MDLLAFSTCICSLISYVAAAESTVPVFLLDYDLVMTHVHVERNPFVKISFNKFSQVVEDSVRYKVIIFVEDNFSVEDISTKDKFYGTPFKNLQATLLEDSNKVKYLPSVIQPCYALRKIFPPKKDNTFHLAQRTKLQLKDNLKYVYMDFQDGVNETKVDAFKRHDTIIREVLSALRQMKAGPIVAFYTGKYNPVVVKKVDYVDPGKTESRKKGIVVQSPRVLFQLYGVHTTHQSRRFYYEQQPTATEETYSKHRLTTKFAFHNMELKWQFAFHKFDWEITDVYLYEANEQVGHFPLHAGAPHNYSYYCSEPLYILNVRDGTHFTIATMLVDPANQYAVGLYNPLVHCAPFYSSESLSAFVIGYFLGAMLLLALMITFDCSTYDRFDDPNGKPLVHEVLH